VVVLLVVVVEVDVEGRVEEVLLTVVVVGRVVVVDWRVLVVMVGAVLLVVSVLLVVVDTEVVVVDVLLVARVLLVVVDTDVAVVDGIGVVVGTVLLEVVVVDGGISSSVSQNALPGRMAAAGPGSPVTILTWLESEAGMQVVVTSAVPCPTFG